jgi:hypothetical protein
LSFVVESYLQGKTENLKERTIAIHALGRAISKPIPIQSFA